MNIIQYTSEIVLRFSLSKETCSNLEVPCVPKETSKEKRHRVFSENKDYQIITSQPRISLIKFIRQIHQGFSVYNFYLINCYAQERGTPGKEYWDLFFVFISAEKLTVLNRQRCRGESGARKEHYDDIRCHNSTSVSYKVLLELVHRFYWTFRLRTRKAERLKELGRTDSLMFDFYDLVDCREASRNGYVYVQDGVMITQ